MCAIVVESKEVGDLRPLVFSRDEVAFRVQPNLSAVTILRLLQAFLLILGVSQENDGQATCWCGEPIRVPKQ